MIATIPMISRIQKYWGRLSRSGKFFGVALITRVLFSLFAVSAGVQLPGSGLVWILLVIAFFLILGRALQSVFSRLLWRVRYRLLATWFLLGVVPIALISVLVVLGLYILMGQVVGYMTSSEISRESELVRSSADALAWSVTHRTASATVVSIVEPFVKQTSEIRHAEVGAIVRRKNEVVVAPSSGPIKEIPAWSKPEFVGLIRGNEKYYFGVHVLAGESADQTEVFLYQYAPPGFFENLLAGVATIRLLDSELRAEAGGLVIQRTDRPRSGFNFDIPSAKETDPDLRPAPPPRSRGWWDYPVGWFVPVKGTELDSGKEDVWIAVVASRPSLIVGKLFGTLGRLVAFAVILMTVVSAVLLFVEIVSLIFGATLTRSITRAVADLYEGTRRVQEGDFSHRIPIRTRDQLSDLSQSFNAMTGRIQGLIVEAKEKERLENELRIAQDVQSQLFPKEFPRLKTLELWGGCQPARSVSGDYYDFIPMGPDRAALAIGDVSGKGISAALLMAHIQSALRSQLMLQNNLGNVLPANASGIMSILNDHLYGSSPAEKYATFFLGLYTDDGGRLIYTTAGHLPPMIVRQGEVKRLSGDGFPVGMFPGIQYEQHVAQLQSGDLLVGFTDGITEAPNGNGDEFGDERLADLIARNWKKPLEEIALEITSSVAAWTGDAERHDDTTLILARHI